MNKVVGMAEWPSDKRSSERNTGSGQEPPGGSVEARVAKLESDVEYIKRDIGELKSSARTIEQDVVALKMQMATLLERTDTIKTSMVTKGQMAGFALVALLGVIGGGWWIVQQYLAPILAGIPK